MLDSYICEILEINPLTDTVSQIILRNFLRQKFVPGQYVNVLTDEYVAPLSIACPPNTKRVLEFHLNCAPHNKTAHKIHQLAQQQKYWRIAGPCGDCTIKRLNVDKPLNFIAFGTGFAPIKAIIEEIFLRKSAVSISVHWVVASEKDLYLMNLLNEWQRGSTNFAYHPIFYADFINKETATDYLVKGLLKQQTNFSEQQVYVSGPRPFVYAIYAGLQTHGLIRENFFSDVFL